MSESSVQEGVALAPVNFLDQSLWQQFQRAGDPLALAQSWLALQCMMLGADTQGSVVLKRESTFRPVADWPHASTRSTERLAVAEAALLEQQGVARQLQRDGQIRPTLAYPLLVQDVLEGVVVVELPAATAAEQQVAMRQLQWGSVWFELLLLRARPLQHEALQQRLAAVLDMLAAALAHHELDTALAAVSSELAALLHCERVSIGFVKGHNIQVQALSNSAQFDKRTNIMRAVGMALDEAMDQHATVVAASSESGERMIDRAQHRVMELSGAQAVCSVPLVDGQRIIGGLCLERSGEANTVAFSGDDLRLLEHLATLLGPLLELKRREARWIGRKLLDAAAAPLHKLLGPRHFVFKLASVTLLGTLTLLALLNGQHRVTADATLEGWTQRHIASPIDGYIAAASAKAGDIVSQGQPLFQLENKELQLELGKWRNQKQQIMRKYREALVQRDKPKAGVYRVQLEQAEAELALIRTQLARTRAHAPFAGLVVMGDLSQRLGAPVEKGETLMQIAPLDDYRVVLSVADEDITWVRAGQSGTLTLSAMPGQRFDFEVRQVTPVAVADQGVNTFTVEAVLLADSDKLRPGMQGAGKVDIGQRSQLWIWTHGLFDWVRLWLWRWWP